MEENTMEITKLKVEVSHKKAAKLDRMNYFAEAREKQAKKEFDDLVQQFEEQCTIELQDEKYRDFLIEQQLKEEEKDNYYAELYEKAMLANEDLLNLEDVIQ